MANIYIHIPFCNLKCKYCRFASFWVLQKKIIEKYIDFLVNEMINFRFKTDKIDTIYLWWWTPAILDKQDLQKIFYALWKKFCFSDNLEVTIESTASDINKEKLYTWEKIWINRISIWIQTFNQKSLQEINRWNKNDFKNCFSALNNYLKFGKIKNFNFDFIIWLPYVKKWEILNDIKKLIWDFALVKHLSVYMLEDYYNKDRIIENKFDNIVYPNTWEKLWIAKKDYLWEYVKIKNFLQKKWFSNYEISNFWKAWYECKHNIWYWTHKETFAFWLSASWLVKQKNDFFRYSNFDNFLDYYSQKKVTFEKLTKNDIFLEKLIFWIRTKWISHNLIKNLDQEKLDYFLNNKYLFLDNNYYRLTNKWILVMDYILSELI